MLGTFLTDSGPVQVPEVVIRYAAEQLGIEDWTAVKQYGDLPATPYDHAAQIRKLLGYREFTGAEAEVTAFIASRVATTRDSKRDLFDRAVLWLIENRVLLPGISTLSRLVAEVRRAGLAAINSTLAGAAPPHMHRELMATLTVPDGKKVSVLEWMRTPVTRVSGTSSARRWTGRPCASSIRPNSIRLSRRSDLAASARSAVTASGGSMSAPSRVPRTSPARSTPWPSWSNRGPAVREDLGRRGEDRRVPDAYEGGEFGVLDVCRA